MAGELADLVRRYGGVVRSAPAVREVVLDDCACAVADFVNRIAEAVHRVHVFLTGAGATALLQEAERQGSLATLVASLKCGTIVCRGPKPTAALKRYGISPNVNAASPFTSQELLDAMAGIDLAGVDVTVTHYGEPSELLTAAFRERGAILHELCVYEWRLPEDIAPIQELVCAIVQREVDAVVFTSQVQWKHLRQVASDLGCADALVRSLNTGITVAAVGPICAAVLTDASVPPHIVPENPKMGPLVAALAQHFSANPTNFTNPSSSRPEEVELSPPVCCPHRAGPILPGG